MFSWQPSPQALMACACCVCDFLRFGYLVRQPQLLLPLGKTCPKNNQVEKTENISQKLVIQKLIFLKHGFI